MPYRMSIGLYDRSREVSEGCESVERNRTRTASCRSSARSSLRVVREKGRVIEGSSSARQTPSRLRDLRSSGIRHQSVRRTTLRGRTFVSGTEYVPQLERDRSLARASLIDDGEVVDTLQPDQDSLQ